MGGLSWEHQPGQGQPSRTAGSQGQPGARLMYSRAGERWGKGWETPGNNWTRPTFPSSSQSSLLGQPRASLELELVTSGESNPASLLPRHGNYYYRYCVQGVGSTHAVKRRRKWPQLENRKGLTEGRTFEMGFK